MNNYTVIVSTTIVWWICSAYFNIYAKLSLAEYKSPSWSKTLSYSLTLTLQQLFTSSILYLISSKLFQTKFTSNSKTSISWTQWFTITKVPAFCFAINALLSNTIISLSSITNFQMYKSLEPMFIVIVMYVFDPVKTKSVVNTKMLACIAVIVTGVTVSTTNSETFNTTSVILAVITNLCFSVRSVLVKTIQTEQKPEKIDENVQNPLKTQSDESKINVFDIFGCCCIFGFLFISLTSIIFFIFKSTREIELSAFIFNPNVMITSVLYFSFNFLSFVVLGYVTSADHSLMKIGKRTCVLVGAKVMLHEAMTTSMWLGVCLTLAGLFAYNLAKSKTGLEGGRKKEHLAIIALLVVGVVPLLQQNGIIKVNSLYGEIGEYQEILEDSKHQQNQQKQPQSHISQSHTSKSNLGNWLSCLKSIQTTQFDIFNPIFTDPTLTGSKKPILYIDPANHANFGDTLLSQGTYQFLAAFGYGKRNLEVCRVTQSHKQVPECGDFSQYSNKGIKLAVWQPGGNWGDLYYSGHKRRMATFKNLLKNKFTVVGLPQSIHFNSPKRLDDDADFLKKMIEESGVSMEVAKERIILSWRQKNSYETAMDKYGFVTNLLVPDMAFQVGPLLDQDRYPNSLVNNYEMQKKDFVFLMRSDKESVYSSYRNQTVIRELLDTLPGGKNITFILDDWPMIKHPNTYYQRVSASVRDKTKTDLDFDFMEREAMSFMSLGKVLITDRLHGSIFGFLAYKPHVYLENSYKKVSLTREVAFNSSEVCSDQSLMHYEAASDFHDALTKAIVMLDDLF